MNILYAGSNGTSGYAIATKNSIFNLLMNGHNVTFHPIQVDNSLQQQDIISIEVDNFTQYEYYKGIPGNYNSFVYTDYITREKLVESRDWLEKSVLKQLNIQKVLNTNSSLYEHSMGQMPNFV